MTKRRVFLGLLLIVGVAAVAARGGVFGKADELAASFPPFKWLFGEKAAAQAPSGAPQPRAVAVEVAKAVKKDTPVILEALGNVTTIASVAVRSRIDSEITGIHFADGAFVKQGDLLITLDSRTIEAQLTQAEGNLARDQASLAQAERDVRRAVDLLSRGAGPQLNVETAQTQVGSLTGAIKADKAAIENLKVQLTFCFIKAQISGRISQAAIKVGNFARAADVNPIATINQMAPVYVTFQVSQRALPELRIAMAEGVVTVEAIIPGDTRRARGRVTMIENAIDQTTGLATIRATMPNEDELLWPGTLVKVEATLRSENAIIIPTPAVQVSQQGSFVFVVKDNIATVVPIKVARLLGTETVVESGLSDGDVVVTDGHLLLNNGSRVTVRERKAGA